MEKVTLLTSCINFTNTLLNLDKFYFYILIIVNFAGKFHPIFNNIQFQFLIPTKHYSKMKQKTPTINMVKVLSAMGRHGDGSDGSSPI
jgi:hypothetical protein